MPRDKEDAFPWQAWENSQACSLTFEASPSAGNRKFDMPETRKRLQLYGLRCVTVTHPTDPGSTGKGAGRCPEGMGAVRGPEHPWDDPGSRYGEPDSVSDTAPSLWTSVKQASVICRTAAAFF